MSELRDYQERAVRETCEHWASGARSVCLVAPTGAGKTRMGEELIDGVDPVVWCAHREELVLQTQRRLAMRFGPRAVGTIMGDELARPEARIQVATIQTLLKRERPPARRIVLDEAHHYQADRWAEFARGYPEATVLGLTATPERQDGRALGDTFEQLVVSASYSSLIAAGHLVPARVYRPHRCLGNDLAQDPIDAWIALAEGSRAFMFCSRVAAAQHWAARFVAVGVCAKVIHCDTPKSERSKTLSMFAAGKVHVIVNVNTMTEGVDIPEARTIILARSFGHVGGYLQAVGRGLRPSSGKPDMILIDLVGASIRHGLPTQDRGYSLDGRAISGGEVAAVERTDGSQDVLGLELQMVARGALPEVPSNAVARPSKPDIDPSSDAHTVGQEAWCTWAEGRLGIALQKHGYADPTYRRFGRDDDGLCRALAPNYQHMTFCYQIVTAGSDPFVARLVVTQGTGWESGKHASVTLVTLAFAPSELTAIIDWMVEVALLNKIRERVGVHPAIHGQTPLADSRLAKTP